MHSKNLICPYCGSDFIEEEDCIDTETIENGFKEYHVGFCKNCEKDLSWDKVFIFDHYEI